MFKRFAPDAVSSNNQVKASVQRSIRARIGAQYPLLEESGVLDVLLPKKDGFTVAKWDIGGQLVVVNKEILFSNFRDGPWFPSLRLLHKYPDMMPKLRVDRGAIKCEAVACQSWFVLGGANIMCPGLTSPGATLHDEVDADSPVAIYAEGKEVALAVGLTKLSCADMRAINKDIAVETIHYLNDGLWKFPRLE